MLIDSLVLSRLIYALPVWGTMLTLAHQQQLQRLHNWGVHIATSLQKFDHVSYHFTGYLFLLCSDIVHCVLGGRYIILIMTLPWIHQ